MSKSRKILKNILSLSFAELATKGIVFFMNGYLARILLTDGFGTISYANGIIVYFVMIVNLGFNVVGTREIAQHLGKLKNYVDSIVTIRLILAVVASVGLFVTTLFLNEPDIVKNVILISGISLLSNALMLDWVYQGLERLEIQAIRQVVTGVLNLICVLTFVHSSEHTALAMLIMMLTNLVNALWMLFYYTKKYHKFSLNFNVELWRKMLDASLPIMFTTFSVSILHTLNIIMLGNMFEGKSEVGVFSAGHKILMFVIMPTGIIQGAFLPLMSKTKNLESFQNIVKKFSVILYTAGAIITAGIFTFSDFVVTTIYGEAFARTIEITQVLMITSIIIYINTSITHPLLARNKEKLIMYATLVAAGFNIIFNLLWIPTYGALGAAWTTTLSEGILALILIYALYKEINRFYILDFLKIVLYGVVSCSIGYYISQFGVHDLLAGIISFIIFVGINFMLKTFTISEIKGYFAK